MNCEQVARDELIEKYLNGQLETALERDFQVHILDCPECLALLETCEDIRDDLAERTPVVGWTPKKRIWNLGSARFPWRIAALAGLASLAAVIVVVGVRTGVIPWHGGHGTDISKGSTKQPTTGPGGGQGAFPEIAALSSAEQPGVWKAINSRNISYPPDLAELRGRQATLLGESPEGVKFRVLEPIGEVVMEPRPLLHWHPLTGAVSYSVAIFDSKANPVQTSPLLHLTQWKPARPLQRGQVYQWQVTAVMSDGKRVIAPSFPNPRAKFRVIDQAKADELEQFRQAHPDAHLVLGILYTEGGLLKDGERELVGIPANNRDFELAQQLLRSIRELR